MPAASLLDRPLARIVAGRTSADTSEAQRASLDIDVDRAERDLRLQMHITQSPNPSSTHRGNPIATCAMRDAWAMVRKAQTLYGGNARQYIAEALRLAWAALNGNGVVLEFRSIIRDIRDKSALKSA